MAFTKLYLRTTAAPYTPATIRGAWDDTAGAVTALLDSAPGLDTYTNVTRIESSTTTEYDVLLYRGVSGPLDAQTISGTLDVVIGVWESATGNNDHWHLHVYVTQGDSDTPRGTLLTDYREAVSVNEWPSDGFSRATGTALNAAQSLSSLAISAGDRLVVEIGYAARNTAAGNLSGSLQYGAIYGHADLPVGLRGDITDRIGNGYLVFSNSITEVSQVGRVSQLGVEALTFEDSAAARVSQFFVETLSAYTAPLPLAVSAAETITVTDVTAVRIDVAVSTAETLTVTDVATPVLHTMLAVSPAETLTVTDDLTTVTTTDLYQSVAETITLAESVSQFVNVLALTVFEGINLDDEPILPLGTAVSDRVFVRDFAFLAPNRLVVSAVETLTVTDGQLYSTSGGVPGTIGPEPSPPPGSTGLTDYWQTGI